MREFEISEQGEHYHKRKRMKRGILVILYGGLLGALTFMVLTKNAFFLYLFLMVVSSIINYHTNITTIRFNPAPEVFSSLIITKLFSLNAALVFLFIPTLFIDFYTARLDIDTFISIIFTAFISLLLSLFPSLDFVVFGIFLITVKFVSGLLINMAMDISPQEIVFEHVLGFVSNIVLMLAFGQIVLALFL
jgi:hypothetical protein